MKNINKQIICISIIILLVGVNFSSGISVDTKTTSVENCGCSEVDDIHLQFLERQYNRLEVYSKLLLVLSKHYPELRNKCKKLSYQVSTLKEMNSNRPICDNLESIISDVLPAIEDTFREIIGMFPEGSLMNILLTTILFEICGPVIALYGAFIFITALAILCDWAWDLIPYYDPDP